MARAVALAQSTIGSKLIVALTGLGLLGFVILHLLGNLQIYLGEEAINSYAEALKDKPLIVWSTRLLLLLLFVVHIVVGIRLKLHNHAARPVGYVYQHTEEASYASRSMVWTGLL